MHAPSSSQSVSTNDDNKAFFQDHHHHRGGDDAPDTPIRHEKNHEEIVKQNASGNRVSTLQKIDETELSTTSDAANLSEKSFIHYMLTITPKEINSSIVSSEDTRVICSIVVAILVVLSHVNLPHSAVKSKSLIAYRPLYVVLLTDVLIVGARLALYTRCREEEDKEAKVEEGGENWGGAVKLLEWGLVLHQTLRAIFIDCSFYVAIVVCGLSIV
ncbi:hypothetical protein BUALT_Bualt07G0140900 [Buddleja alternifolia]|uniref:Uncharacterized protein n=1 Tax=Buddleja alternifolia TaxID=168488 RepID=A0AAV6XL62_9LAMI|nr:hypothetical protein BUALT_Bualt07G0140900 [Buddleja alternifolia]